MTTKEPTLPSTTSTPDKLPSYPPPPSFSDYLSLESLTPKPLLLSKEEDEKSTILPSFYDLRRKNHQTLYGSGDSKDDKSPKGSVDEPIRPLVDLINKHSDYCTLSSCSGRISLFDPNQQHLQRGDERETTIRNESSDNGTKRTASGKGTGGWLLVSHYPIHPNELVTCFENSTFFHTKHQPQKAWIFKLEPLVLHVAASSLHRGQQLLRLGLELGFRESGLVVSDKRVTVAIRGHSLALSIPCLPGGSLSLPKDYWTSLVNTQANPRLIQNWNQLDRLYRSIRLNWFDVSPTRLMVSSSSSRINTIAAPDTISSLNLWDMATVHTATTSNARKVDDIWCFGGYGIGPNPTNSNSQRSSNVYRLRQIQKDCTDNNGDLDERNQSNDQDWELINVVAPENQTPPCWQFITGGLQVSWQSKFPSCQGMAACQLSNGWIVIWGGRTSPTKPQNTLYLWDSIRHMLATPLSSSIKGTLPAPRWGHSLVAISNNRAVLVGGCNQDHGAMDDIHLLIWDEQDGSFFWERLAMSLPSPRFHHMTTLIQTKNGICDDDDDIILVLGGLRSTTDVLGCVSKNENENAGLIWAFQIEETKLLETKATASGNVNTRKQEEHRRIPSTRVRQWNVSKEGLPKTLSSRWGSATCQIYSNNNPIMVVSGGITPIDGDDDDDDSVTLPPLEAFFLTKQKYRQQDTIHVTCVPTDITSINSIQTSETELIDFGSLVHHSCIAISENEFLLLGGGVASFAFGDCFAKYVCPSRVR